MIIVLLASAGDFSRLANKPLHTKKVYETITFSVVTLPNIHRLFTEFTEAAKVHSNDTDLRHITPKKVAHTRLPTVRFRS